MLNFLHLLVKLGTLTCNLCSWGILEQILGIFVQLWIYVLFVILPRLVIATKLVIAAKLEMASELEISVQLVISVQLAIVVVYKQNFLLLGAVKYL